MHHYAIEIVDNHNQSVFVPRQYDGFPNQIGKARFIRTKRLSPNAHELEGDSIQSAITNGTKTIETAAGGKAAAQDFSSAPNQSRFATGVSYHQYDSYNTQPIR